MFDIQPIDIDVPEALPARQEVQNIFHGLVVGGAIREAAMFRIWRMWKDKTYLDIVSDDPDTPDRIMYPTFSDFIYEICNNLEVSRSKIYNRIRAYSQLEFLGFSNQQMLVMMSSRPGLYEKALNMIFEWDQEIPGPTAFKTDAFGDVMNDESLLRVKRFVEELGDHESVKDALGYLKHDVMGKPEVSIIFSKDDANFRIEYTSTVLEGDGSTSTTYHNMWHPGEDLPDWVVEEINRRYHVKVY